MTKKQPKEIRLEAILSAAVEEFLEKGYNGASMDAIARRAGVSKGGLYHHFPNKEILLMIANQKLSEPVMLMAQAALTSESPLEGLREYIRSYFEYWISRKKELSFLFLSMSKALESQSLLDYYKEYVIETTEFYVRMFKNCIKAGELKLDDPEAYAISLMGALDGVLGYCIISEQDDTELICNKFEQVWLRRG